MKRLLYIIFVAVFVCCSCRFCLAEENETVDVRFFDDGNYLDYDAIRVFYTEFYLLAKDNHYTTPTDFYTGGFVNGYIPDVQDKNRTNVLLLGGVHDVDTEKLEDFDFIFVSQADLSAFLNMRGIKNHFLPQFIDAQAQNPSYCVQNASNPDCYFLVIGEQPYIRLSLEASQIPYKYFEKITPTEEAEIKADLEHVSGIILNDMLHFENSNDVTPSLLYAIDRGIPVLMASSIAFANQFDTRPLFRLAPLFADAFSYYSYSSDVDYFFMYPQYRLEKSALAQKILYYLYSAQTAAHNVLQIMTKNEAFVPPLANTLNIMLTVFPGIYNNGDYWIASDLADGLKNEYADILVSFPDSLISKLGDVFIYLRGGRRLHENLVKENTVSLLYLFYSLTSDKQDIPSIKEYIQQFSDEFKHADAVITASPSLAEAIREDGIEAYYIPQFTNIHKFYPDYDEEKAADVLFVGNYTPYRQAVPILLNADVPVSVYGDAWPGEIAKNRYVDNRILRKYYSSAKIVLNDTRADMRELGFISNRIFDATACETLVISDYMKEIKEVYGDSIPMWKTEDDLVALVKYYLAPEHEKERLNKAKRAREITLKNFTSDKASQGFQAIINDIKQNKGLTQ